MAGYSQTPLPQKLGIKPAHKLCFVSAPPEFATALGALPAGVAIASRAGQGPYDVIVAFFTVERELAASFPKLAPKLASDGGFWIAWPKKSAKLATDLHEN